MRNTDEIFFTNNVIRVEATGTSVTGLARGLYRGSYTPNTGTIYSQGNHIDMSGFSDERVLYCNGVGNQLISTADYLVGTTISSGTGAVTINGSVCNGINRFDSSIVNPNFSSAPSSPVSGQQYFDTTLNKLRVYDGTAWQNCW